MYFLHEPCKPVRGRTDRGITRTACKYDLTHSFVAAGLSFSIMNIDFPCHLLRERAAPPTCYKYQQILAITLALTGAIDTVVVSNIDAQTLSILHSV